MQSNYVSDQDFILHVQLIYETLKTCNLPLLDEFEQLFSTLMSSSYFNQVLLLAALQIAETHVEAYCWFLQNYLHKALGGSTYTALHCSSSALRVEQYIKLAIKMV